MTLIDTGLSLAKGVFSTGVSFLGGIKTYLIVGALVGAVAGAGGWYAGSTHEAKIQANAAVHAAQEAQAAQAKKDAVDYAEAKADYEKRLAAEQKANDTLAYDLAHKHALVPNPTKAFIPAAAMKALNDPALIGDSK